MSIWWAMIHTLTLTIYMDQLHAMSRLVLCKLRMKTRVVICKYVTRAMAHPKSTGVLTCLWLRSIDTKLVLQVANNNPSRPRQVTQKLDLCSNAMRAPRGHSRSLTRLASALENFLHDSVFIYTLVAGISRFRSQNPLWNKKAKLHAMRSTELFDSGIQPKTTEFSNKKGKAAMDWHQPNCL